MRRAIAILTAAALVLLTVTSGKGHAQQAFPGPGVPEDFIPAAMSWPDTHTGWVLGFTPCAAGTCASLLRTTDGGQRWWRTPAPDVSVPDTHRMRMHFAGAWDGVVTDGRRLFHTRSGGLFWQETELPGTGRVTRLAATEDAYLAVQSGDSATRLLSAPRWTDHWRPVPGVTIPANGAGDVVTRGRAAHVVLGAVFRAQGYWVRDADGTWQAARPPCALRADTDLGLAGTGPVHALCSYNPGMGQVFKDLMRAAPDNAFTGLGQAPVLGITRGFAMAGPHTPLVGAVGRGAAFLHRGTVADGTATWTTPLTVGGLPWRDLAFPEDGTGYVLWGGPRWGDATVYRTGDAGRTWVPLDLRTW